MLAMCVFIEITCGKGHIIVGGVTWPWGKVVDSCHWFSYMATRVLEQLALELKAQCIQLRRSDNIDDKRQAKFEQTK